jgi:hypothetical protein
MCVCVCARYQAATKDLTALRDVRTALVNEAMGGIRVIKASSAAVPPSSPTPHPTLALGQLGWHLSPRGATESCTQVIPCSSLPPSPRTAPWISQAAGWEEWMMGKVEVARRNEARALRKQQLMGTANMWLGWVLHAAHGPTVSISDSPCQPIHMLLSNGLPCHHRFFIPSAVTAASFYAYTRLSDKPLSSAIAFASLAWFDILRTPLWSLPFLIQNLVQVNISLKCVLTFNKVSLAPVSGAAGLAFVCRLPGAHAPLRVLIVPWRLAHSHHLSPPGVCTPS